MSGADVAYGADVAFARPWTRSSGTSTRSSSSRSVKHHPTRTPQPLPYWRRESYLSTRAALTGRVALPGADPQHRRDAQEPVPKSLHAVEPRQRSAGFPARLLSDARR
eukprot:561277-Rhodomonas_salina.2